MSKAALVTGGAIRIGKAIALGLAKEGYDIALHYNHSEKEALKTQKLIQNYGVICKLYSANFLVSKQTQSLLSQVTNDFKHLHVLINNASLYAKGQSIENESINFRAPAILSKEFARTCKKGHIINILDSNITKNLSNYPEYLASKKALASFTQKAALMWAPNIQVNGIAPGVILPPSCKTRDYLLRRIQRIPLKRKGHVRYIVQAITFLLSNPFITGDILFVDGGEHLQT